ncbi:MAG: DUF1156 domain-containing protein, partial [Pirellulales bacterium]|nr:DUF1156 domain-containing protein [Pirellulales bacterium]
MNEIDDLRLIEDFLPIDAISEASEEKRQISGLHLWWARRPLVTCRAAVYAALVPAQRWVGPVTLQNPPDDASKAAARKSGTRKGLNRRASAEFVKNLSIHGHGGRYLDEARRHILKAHAARLSQELLTPDECKWLAEFKFQKDLVTVDDLKTGKAPLPRVLDPFAGGGAIP